MNSNSMKSKPMKSKAAKHGAAATADAKKTKKKKSKADTESSVEASKRDHLQKKSKSTSKTPSKEEETAAEYAATASSRRNKQSSNLKTPPELLSGATSTSTQVRKQPGGKKCKSHRVGSKVNNETLDPAEMEDTAMASPPKERKKKKRKSKSSEDQLNTPSPFKSTKGKKQSSPATASTVSTKRSETSFVRNDLEAFDLCSDASSVDLMMEGRALASDFQDSTIHDSSKDSKSNKKKKKKKKGAPTTNQEPSSSAQMSSPAKKSPQKKKPRSTESRNEASKSPTKKSTKSIEIDVPEEEEYGPDNLPRVVDLKFEDPKQILQILLLVTNIDKIALKEMTHKKRVEILLDMFKPKPLGMAFTHFCLKYKFPYQGLDLDSMFMNKTSAMKAYMDLIFGGKEK